MPGPAPAAAADDSPIQRYLAALHAEFLPLRSGEVATYIPELAKVEPDGFGIVLATVDGQVYEVGDSRRLFSIQSVSKPFVYGIALADRGREAVAAKIGVEPTGDAFNSISLEPGTGRPMNPMINAGAIAAASLVAGGDEAECLQRVLQALSAYAGRPLDVDEAIYASERDTGHRNRAIGHMLRNYGIIEGDPEPALNLYFRQCSVRVDCRDLALMAATLANGGCHPLTGAQAVPGELTEPILSVMASCGMYDFSGTWVHGVGLPAKSGVGGGVIAVLPGQLGIAVYSPRLDDRGNSARGVAVCRRMSTDLGLHFLQPPRPGASAMRARYTLQRLRSKRRRSAADNAVLDAQGQRVAVFELQGDLRFASIEPVLRAVVADAPLLAVLDFKRVAHVDGGATRMLAALASRAAAHGQHLLLARVRRDLLGDLGNWLAPQALAVVHFQPQLDSALEWCERWLLQRAAGAAAGVAAGVAAGGAAGAAAGVPAGAAAGAAPGAAAEPARAAVPKAAPPPELPLAEHRLCQGLSAAQCDQLQRWLQRHQHDAGSSIVRRGEPADALHLLVAGEVSVLVPLPGGGQRRLATLVAGMPFGEAALIAGGQRSADVRADTAVTCWTLSTAAYATLQREAPAVAICLLHNLLLAANETVVRLTAEVAALEA